MTTKKATKNYKELRKELDDVLSWFDSEEIDIDEAIERYKKARLLTKELEVYLSNAENTLKKI